MSETALSEFGVYSARPTVRINEQEYPKVSELIRAMEMTEAEGGLSALELRLSNWASNPEGKASLAFDDDQIVKMGATIAVYSGDLDNPQEIFRGKITGLEADFPEDDAPELTVLAEDAFQAARMARRTKYHETLTIAGFARDLAGQLSLKPVINGFSDAVGPQMQWDESDLAFLRRLLARYDGDAQIVGKELHLSPRSDVQRGTVTLALHSQLRRARVLVDLAHQTTQVTVSGWDAKQGQRVTGTGTGANLGPGSGQKGADKLRDALGERSHHVAHLAAATTQEAQAIADSAFDARARRFVVLEGVAEGNPALRVGTSVTITGLGKRFDNTYYVVRARHRYDQAGGYETEFEAECAFMGAA